MMMKSLFKGCNQISNTSLITCRTFPTCSPHNNQSLHDKPPARVAGVLVRNLILVRALKFSRESVLAVLSVHLRIAGRRHRSCTLLKASLYAQRITCARALTDIPVRDHFSLRMLVVTSESLLLRSLQNSSVQNVTGILTVYFLWKRVCGLQNQILERAGKIHRSSRRP